MDIATDLALTFSNLPAQLAVVLIAMLPVAELRGALPVALTIYDMGFWSAYFWSVLGNMIPVFFILYFIEPVSNWLRKTFKFMDRFFIWWFDRTVKKTEDKIKLYGPFALLLFVAIPLPFTGAWTGSLAAYLFKIKPKIAIPIIFLGVLIAGIVVGIITVGAKAIF